MKARHFTDDPRVRKLIAELKTDGDDKPVSDIVDGQGRQYVDLVMEGGGVLGIALLGYTYALEQAGIRFLSIGGTSAGSIGALLLAAVDTKEHPKSLAIAEALANQDISEFVDGSMWARRLIFRALDGGGWVRLGLFFLLEKSNFIKNLGFNPGERFLEWLTDTLAAHGIHTAADLEARMAHAPEGLQKRDGTPLAAGEELAELAIITAEVPTKTKVQLPKMASLFWEDPQAVNPAAYVRASMSIPYFFYPYRLAIPQGTQARERWRTLAGFRGAVPQEALLVDGGIMSNFPIDVFHNSYVIPACPTFGVKLGLAREKGQCVDGPLSLGYSAFNAARHTLDFDFIRRNPDYYHLVEHIDTGDHHWIDFNLTKEAKIDLFRRGVEAAVAFLERFDWANYKSIRRELMEAYQRSAPRPPALRSDGRGAGTELEEA